MYQMIDILNQVQDEMRFTTHPDVYLEVLTIRLSQIDDSQQEKVTNAADERELTRLKQQVEKLQQLVKQLQQPGGTQPKTVKAQKRRENTGVQPVRINLEQVYRILDHATKQDLIDLQNMWPDVLNMLNPAYRSLLELSKPVAASPDGVVVSFDNGFCFKKLQSVA